MIRDSFIDIMESDVVYDYSFLASLSMIQKYTTASLLNDSDDNVYHIASIDDMLLHDITEEDVLYIRNSGWCLDDKKENIIKTFF